MFRYIDLKAEAVNIAGPDDHIIHDLLQKLVRWSLEDAKSVPNAKVSVHQDEVYYLVLNIQLVSKLSML